MSDWVIEIVKSMGYVGIALLTLLENVFPPIPSELIMPLAGYNANQGEMSLPGAIAAGSLGSLIGCTGWYFVGRRIGEERLRNWIERHGKWLTLTAEDIDRASDWFRRHRGSAVFFGRLIPGIRTWISVPAGINGMNLGPFLVYSSIGTTLWTTMLTAAGWWVGASFGQIGTVLGYVTNAVIAGTLIWYIYRLIRLSKGGRRKSQEDSVSRAVPDVK